MKVVYRYYDEEQSLEEIQAQIFTEASGLPAIADGTYFMTRDPGAIPLAELQPELELFEIIPIKKKE